MMGRDLIVNAGNYGSAADLIQAAQVWNGEAIL